MKTKIDIREKHFLMLNVQMLYFIILFEDI